MRLCSWLWLLAHVTYGLLLAGFPTDTMARVPAETERPTADFFVAANGSDQWSGQLALPNRAGTDGPFATLVRARDAIRELKHGRDKKEILGMMRGGALLRTAAKELFLNLLRTTVINTLSIYPRHPAKRRPTHSWDTTRFSRRSQISRSIARRWLGDEPIVEIGLAMVPQKRKQAALAPFPEAARIRPSVLRPAQNHDRLSAYPASCYA